LVKQTIAEQLGAFVTQVTYDELPPEVVEKAKRHILDTFGAALAGATSEEAARAKAALLAVEPGGSAPVWGTDHLATPRNAALLNGIAAHAFELDDNG
jgi:2-methylcitrate dehydratase PrpD